MTDTLLKASAGSAPCSLSSGLKRESLAGWEGWGDVPEAGSYLLMAMAMMTGSQPEYSTSLVDGLRRASTTQTGSRATKKAHTRG